MDKKFLYKTPKAQKIKAKTNKLDYIKFSAQQKKQSKEKIYRREVSAN